MREQAGQLQGSRTLVSSQFTCSVSPLGYLGGEAVGHGRLWNNENVFWLTLSNLSRAESACFILPVYLPAPIAHLSVHDSMGHRDLGCLILHKYGGGLRRLAPSVCDYCD